MSVLRCDAENCIHNMEKLCCRGEICVGGRNAQGCGDTCCENYVAHREGADVYTSSVSHPDETVSIDCEAARCVFNNGYRCTAECVGICPDSSKGRGETCCMTFIGR